MASAGKACCVVIKILLALVLGLAVPIACMVMAAKYDGKCPIQPYVTIYLYVSGAFCAFKGIQALIAQIMLLGGCCNEGCACCYLVIDVILGIFLFAWFIAGSVWVYQIHNKFNSTDSTASDYCNPTLYNFAFGILTAQWVIAALQILVSMIAKCCGCDESSD